MSICRRGCDGSDIYLYEHCDNFVCCSGCNLNDGVDVALKTDQEIYQHLSLHVANEDSIPGHVFEHFFRITGDKRFSLLAEVFIPPEAPELPAVHPDRAELHLRIFKKDILVKESALGVLLDKDQHERLERLGDSMSRFIKKTNRGIICRHKKPYRL